MRIIVNKCPFTGSIFTDRAEYGEHLLELRKKRVAQARYEKTVSNILKELRELKKEVSYLHEICPWIQKHQKQLMDWCNTIRAGKWGDFFHANDDISNIKLDMSSFKHASNSHVRPDWGLMNWCAQDKNKPTGYPGWTGYCRGSLSRTTNFGSYPMSNLLNFVGIKTSSGGGGNEEWGWDVIIFLEDWPSLAQQWADEDFEAAQAKYEADQIRIMKILKGGHYS